MSNNHPLFMPNISASVKLLFDLAKVQSVLSRRFDNGLGGLGFNEFIILYQLSQAPGQQLRRIDLAEKIGFTPSGVTRVLLPMEKVGLIKSGSAENDARVRNVILAPGGQRRLSESMERAELLATEIFQASRIKKPETLSENLSSLAENI
jgi:DNA-binding MarR family transcriptional regulator